MEELKRGDWDDPGQRVELRMGCVWFDSPLNEYFANLVLMTYAGRMYELLKALQRGEADSLDVENLLNLIEGDWADEDVWADPENVKEMAEELRSSQDAD